MSARTMVCSKGRWGNASRLRRQRANPKRRHRLAAEPLEDRRLLAVISALESGLAIPRAELMADPRENLFHVPAPDHIPSLAGFSSAAMLQAGALTHSATGNASAAPATFVVNYNGFSPQARAAFQFAVDIWAGLISSPVPIVINAQFTPLASDVLGSCGASDYVRNFSKAPVSSTWYPLALANSLAGTDLAPSTGDLDANFNSSFSNWYYGTDSNVPSDQYSFATVVLHEIGHGLGFAGSMRVIGGQGSWGYGTGFPIIFDRFTENGSGQSLINTAAFPNPSFSLGSQLTSGSVYFDGPNANAANGGSRVALYAPSTWNQGSSFSHLDEIFNNTPNALMTYSVGTGESIYSPGPVALGLMKDLGWQLAAAQTPTVTVSATDSTAAEGTPSNPGQFTLTRSGSTASSLSVTVSMSGTATNGWDYATVPSTVTFAAGSATAVVNLSVIDDTVAESGETATLSVVSGSGYIVGSPSSATVTISDNDGDANTTIVNAIDTGWYTSAGFHDPSNTNYFVGDSYANDGLLYRNWLAFNLPSSSRQVVSATLKINAGEVTGAETYRLHEVTTDVSLLRAGGSGKTAIYADLGDGTTYGSRTFYSDDFLETVAIELNASLVAALNAKAGQAFAMGGILTTLDSFDNSEGIFLYSGTSGSVWLELTYGAVAQTVTIVATDANATEGSTADQGLFTLTRSGSTTSSLTVAVSVSGSASNGSDYLSLPSTVTFAAGSATAVIPLVVIEDVLVEGSETATLTVVSGSGYTIGSPSSATVTIADNDRSVEAYIGYPSGSYYPGDSIPYQIVASSGEALIVTEINVDDGYVVGGTLSQYPVIRFNSPGYKGVTARARSAVTGIPCNNGNLIYSTIYVSAPKPAITITATDGYAAEVAAGEASNPGQFTITRSGSTAPTLTVSLAWSGTALFGTDYSSFYSYVTFESGSSTAIVPVYVNDDAQVEGDETAILTVVSDSQYVVGSPASATVTIADRAVERIIDDGDSGFQRTGSSWKRSSSGYLGDSWLLTKGTGSPGASWAFDSVPNGTYDVFATWVPSSSRSPAASFEVTSAGSFLGSRSFNQRQSPGDSYTPGTAWGRVGSYTVTNGVLTVRAARSSLGDVSVDAIRIVSTSPKPEIDIRSNGLTVTTGDTSPSTADGTDFGRLFFDQGQVTQTFVITNTGTAPLSLTGNPVVRVSSFSNVFSVTVLPATTVWPGGSTFFQVTFNPSVLGTHDATIFVDSNDTAKSSYSFSIRATCVPFEAIVDDGDAGFARTGNSWTRSSSGYLRDSLVLKKGSGGDTASWSFSGLPSGTYVVTATWVAGRSRTTAATFQMTYPGGLSAGSAMVNQRSAPADEYSGGVGWARLGVVTVNNGGLVVSVGRRPDGEVSVDAIRVVQLPPGSSLRSSVFASLAWTTTGQVIADGRKKQGTLPPTIGRP